MSEIIAKPYTPTGLWIVRTLAAFQLAWQNFHARQNEVKSYDTWVDDIERLAAKENLN